MSTVSGNNKSHIFTVMLAALMAIVVVITLYPFLNVLAKAFNDPIDTVKGGITIFPRNPTFQNFKDLFATGSNLAQALKISVVRTIIGTVCCVVCCAMFAYPLSRPDFMFRKAFLRILMVTMYVSGGLIPSYILIRSIGLINNFWVYIIPGLLSAWNVIVIRSYMLSLPNALSESAHIDGASDITIFFQIILPLCMPVLATVSLWVAVGHWNDWYTTYIYMTGASKKTLSTLQYEMMKIMDSVNVAGGDYHSEALKSQSQRNPEAMKMAMTIVCTAPILCAYPFVQKYFVTGMTLGSVKE